jgi:hypothetical protein
VVEGRRAAVRDRLVCWAFALQGGRWWLWLWLCMLVPLGIVGVMAARAVERADRERGRRAELRQLHAAWLDHLERGSPTL